MSKKHRSISRIINLGLAVMVVSIILISVFALYGFFSFKLAMEQLVNYSVPQIVQASKLTGSVGQLLADTEKLASATSSPVRRISYENIQKLFEDIKQVKKNDKVLDNFGELTALENTLAELNELVEFKIEVFEKTDRVLSHLLELTGELNRFEKEASAKVGGSQMSSVYVWSAKYTDIISQSGKASFFKTLYKIRRAEVSLQNEFKLLNKLSEDIPDKLKNDVSLFNMKLFKLLSGEDGLLALLQSRTKISMQTSSRGNFAKSLVGDFKSSKVTTLNQLIDTSVRTTNILQKQVATHVVIFTLLSVICLLVACYVIYYFRMKLIKRLTDLNSAILSKVAGSEASIVVTENDEISEMAKSFIYYEDEVRQRETQLRELAMKDPLTGVSNRRHFMEQLESELKKVVRHKRPLAFMMIDIDHFKSVNDTYGHHAGDMVLKGIANMIKSMLREVDCFGRFGGEEFAAFLPETDAASALVVGERIRNKIESAEWVVGDSKIICTISIGISAYLADDKKVEFLIKQADDALYLAKESGRNKVKFGDD